MRGRTKQDNVIGLHPAAEAIREARRAAGMTLEQAAGEKHAPSTVQRWERGSVPSSWSVLDDYAAALGHPITLTFGGSTGHEEAPRPGWAEGLESRIAEAVISALASPEHLRALELLAEQSAGTPPPSDASHGADAAPQGRDG